MPPVGIAHDMMLAVPSAVAQVLGVWRMSDVPVKEHEMSIYDLLEHIRKRPGFFTVERSIFRLDSFLTGYEYGLRQGGFILRQQDDLRRFNIWVARRFGFNGTSGVANMIRDKSASDAEAFDQFFVLLDEFRKE